MFTNALVLVLVAVALMVVAEHQQRDRLKQAALGIALTGITVGPGLYLVLVTFSRWIPQPILELLIVFIR